MKLGIIAAVLFIVVGWALLLGTVEGTLTGDGPGEALITEEMETHMERLNTLQASIEDVGIDSVIEIPMAVAGYFSSLVGLGWQMFNTPIWNEGYWILLKYLIVVPFFAVVVLGLVIVFAGILRRAI